MVGRTEETFQTIVGFGYKLDRVGLVDNRPSTTSCTPLSKNFSFIKIKKITDDMWNVTQDTWLMVSVKHSLKISALQF